MKSGVIILSLLLWSYNVVSGQELREYEKKAKAFISDVRNNKKEKIAGIVKYPLERMYPIPSIKNKKEFLSRYNQIFDPVLIAEILKSDPQKDWKDMGWRGIKMNNGDIWIDENGNLINVNFLSKYEARLRNVLIDEERSKLHASIANYIAPVYVLETPKFRIRIDDLGQNHYRFASWPIKKKMSDKPEVVIDNGQWIRNNNSFDNQFVFKQKGKKIYYCTIIGWGEEGAPPAKFSIYESNKQILAEDAKIIVK